MPFPFSLTSSHQWACYVQSSQAGEIAAKSVQKLIKVDHANASRMQALFLHVEVVTLQFLSLKELRELPALALVALV